MRTNSQGGITEVSASGSKSSRTAAAAAPEAGAGVSPLAAIGTAGVPGGWFFRLDFWLISGPPNWSVRRSCLLSLAPRFGSARRSHWSGLRREADWYHRPVDWLWRGLAFAGRALRKAA